MEPERLRTDETVYIPPDIEIVLYCSSKREFVSARVASALMRRGISNVWVLEGGLALWREQGFPLTLLLSTREQAAARLGIQLRAPRIGSTRKSA
jgi:rhodanese-related sulfurtransferase